MSSDVSDRLREVESLLVSAFPEASKSSPDSKNRSGGKNPDKLLKNIRDIITEVKKSRDGDRHSTTVCDVALQKMGLALDARNRDLSSMLKSANLSSTPKPERRDTRHSIVAQDGLFESVQALDKKLQCYINSEKQISAKFAEVSGAQKMTQSYMDMNDRDVRRMEAEVCTNKSNTVNAFRNILANVQKERRDLESVLSETERVVDGRLNVLDHREDKVEIKEEQKKESENDTQLVHHSKKVKNKVDRYIRHEIEATQYFHSENAKQRRHLTDELKAVRYDLETVEKRAARLEAERDKYKRLYDMERIIKHSSDHDTPRYKAAEHDIFHFHNQVKPEPSSAEKNEKNSKKEKTKKEKKKKKQEKKGCSIC